MYSSYKLLLYTVITFLPVVVFSNLTAGDIAFVHYNATRNSVNGNFAFVALVDIAENEVIKFTDIGWNGTELQSRSTTKEGVIAWTAPPDGVSAGTIITITDIAVATHGFTAELNDLHIEPSGDQILAFQGDIEAPTFIAALNIEGKEWQSSVSNTSQSMLPSGLVDGKTAVATPGERYYAKYNGVLLSGDKIALLHSINKRDYWVDASNVNPMTFTNTVSVFNGVSVSITVDKPLVSESDRWNGTEIIVTAQTSQPVASIQSVELLVKGDGITTSDYTLSNSSFTFSPDSDQASIALSITDDIETEPLEVLRIKLTNPSSGLLIDADTSVPVTLLDNDNTGNLSPGDITFVQYNADGSTTGNFSFVALRDINPNEIIYFTDRGWDGTTFWDGHNSKEGTIMWLAPAEKTVVAPNGGIHAGTVVTIYTSGKRVTHGQIFETNNFTLSQFGDQVLAFQGTTESPRFIAAINSKGKQEWQSSVIDDSESQLPPGLINNENATALNNAIYGVYIGDRARENYTTLLSNINNSNNWVRGVVPKQDFLDVPSFYVEEKVITKHFEFHAALLEGRAASDLATKNNETYIAYLNEKRQLTAAKLDSLGQVTNYLVDSFPFMNDLHHFPAIGLDEEGYIHIVGNMHSLPSNQTLADPHHGQLWRYWISKQPYDITAFDFIDDSGMRNLASHAVGCTYPRFRHAKDGALYLTFRGTIYPAAQQTGEPGTYTAYALRYNFESKTWSSLGTKAQGPFGNEIAYNMWAYEIAGAGGIHYQPMQPVLRVDENTGRIHMATVINHDNSFHPRGTGGSTDGYRSGTAILYGYSDDEGLTWHKSDGSVLSLPTNVATGDVIEFVTPGTIANGMWIGVMPDGNPIIRYILDHVRYAKYWNGSEWSDKLREPLANARYEMDRHGTTYLYDGGNFIIADDKMSDREYFEVENPFFLMGPFDRNYDEKGQARFLAYNAGSPLTISLYTIGYVEPIGLSVPKSSLPKPFTILFDSGQLVINFPSNKMERIRIYDLGGRTVYDSRIMFKNNVASIQPIIESHKVYIMKIRNETMKFIKN